jgi:hypothetical protein
VGGDLTANGWEVTGRTDRLWYSIPVLTSGAIEFTVANVVSGASGNLPLEDHELFTMYEAGHGISEPIPYLSDYRNNNFKVMLRVPGEAAPSDVGRQQLRWKNCASGAPGYSGDGSCSCAAGFDGESLGGDGSWDGTAQRIRIAWTESGAILMRNGVLVAQLDWTGTTSFGPTVLHFALGSSRPDQIDQSGMPIGAVFSDVRVDGLIGTPLPECP